MTNHSEGGTPRTDEEWADYVAYRLPNSGLVGTMYHHPDRARLVRLLREPLERELSAARSALAEKEREFKDEQAMRRRHSDTIRLLQRQVEAAEDRAGEAEKDAERYRWNRDRVYDDLEHLAKSLGPQMNWPSRKDHAAAYDAKIDAAINAAPSAGGEER